MDFSHSAYLSTRRVEIGLMQPCEGLLRRIASATGLLGIPARRRVDASHTPADNLGRSGRNQGQDC